ncbi:zinc finger domain-containing protein [Trichoderma sp. SZMC 28014]
MLSLRGQATATSSDAAADYEEGYRKIGAGACGAIFGLDGKSVVFKLAKTDDDSLWNDFQMHQLIAQSFRKWRYVDVKVPECYYFVPKDEQLYFENNLSLVESAKEICNMPTSVLSSERIPPLPKPTRDLLIEKYCPSQVKQAALTAQANKDCLVRVYLGSLKGRQTRFFSLRNFKLHLDQMAELHLDIMDLAARMATAMALMHWAAKTDARDIEFVLGSSSLKPQVRMSAEYYLGLPGPTYTGPPSRMHEDFFVRTTDLWLLDFNQVQQISMDEAGVAMAVEAVKLNDPYIPKPLQESEIEKQAWNEFVRQYLVSAHDILREEENYRDDLADLPTMFINGVIELERKKQEKRDCITEDVE